MRSRRMDWIKICHFDIKALRKQISEAIKNSLRRNKFQPQKSWHRSNDNAADYCYVIFIVPYYRCINVLSLRRLNER
jgi:hypothetical protein